MLKLFVHFRYIKHKEKRNYKTSKHAPYTTVFGQKLNNLNNIDFGDSNCPMEESVESFLLEIDTVESNVPPDHNKNNPSDITPNSQTKPKPKPAPHKFCKNAKPVLTRLVHIEKPIPKPLPEPSQADDLPNVSIDFQASSSIKDGFDKKRINLSDLLQDKTNIKELTPLKDIQPIEENEDLNGNHQSEESEDKVEKVDIDLDRPK